jgi:hypothetical protein
LGEKRRFVGEKVTTMFEVTIRTDNQAALEKLLEFLKQQGLTSVIIEEN